METVRANVDADGNVTFPCPYCAKAHSPSVGQFKGVKHQIVARCSCKNKFLLVLNFRQFFRKSVNIHGEMKNLSDSYSKWQTVTIINISMGGLRFKAVGKQRVNIGDRLQVRFTLDNPKATNLDKEGIVRNVRSDEYGCEFVNLSYNEKDLGFYLLQDGE